MIHTVQQGDTLFAISRRYNLTTAQLLELNNLQPYDSLRLGQQLIVSVQQGRPTGQPTEFYVVQAGDSLFAISRRFGTTPENLLKINGMQPSQNIYVGQQLKISGSPPPPAPQPTPPVNTPTSIRSTPSGTIPMQGAAATYYTVQRGDSLYSIAVRHGLTPEGLLRMNNLPTNAMIYIGQSLKVGEPTVTPTPVTAKPVENQPIASTGGGVYTVQRGDSLFSIAQRFGSTPQQILQLNGLAANATIYIGQILKVSAPQPAPPASNQNLRIYIVQRGDSLFRIAQQANTTPEEIVRLNQLANGGISVGQQLLLPPPGTGISSTPTPAPVAPTPQPVTPTPTPTPSGNGGPIPSSVPPHLREKYAAIRQARSIFQLEEINGLEIFGSGLSGPVGRVPNMMPADLEKVQARLIQLKLLTPNHGESPAQLMARLGRSPISEGSIPNTVRAIVAFQNRYRTDYWTKNEKHVQMLGTRSHTPGVVAPGDVTYRVMREYAEYRLVVPHATLPGQFISASFSNYVRSFHTIWEGGIGFAGVFMPDVPFEVFANLGIDRSMAVALKYVSSHEGNFDAINTYDKANFSWGFIQFAGKGGNTNGPLNAVIGTMKVRQPQLFAEYFQKIGIDVDVIMRGNQIHDGVLRVFDLHAVTGAYETQGIDAEIALKYDKQLYGAFIRAAYHPEFYKAQIERAVVGYVNPAMSIRTDVNTGQLRLTNIPLTNIISSPMGNCLMLDLTVNQWINRTRDVFRAAIEKVAAIYGLHTPQLLQGIDERQVIQTIIADATDDRIKKRASSILNSELSPAKSPSVPPLA